MLEIAQALAGILQRRDHRFARIAEAIAARFEQPLSVGDDPAQFLYYPIHVRFHHSSIR